jgi:hypothetical protein
VGPNIIADYVSSFEDFYLILNAFKCGIGTKLNRHFGDGMLRLPPGMKKLNSECQIRMIYCLQSWRHIIETISILNVLESCGFG